jgi:hypothetical protein
MIPNAHNPARLNAVKPFSAFAVRLLLALLAATAAISLALHALAESSASTQLDKDDGAVTSQVAPQPSEPTYFPGKPY